VRIVASIYIHIPFCQRICSYCDFPKRVSKTSEINLYLDALKKEVDMRMVDEPIDTVYLGGGTPSLLDINQLGQLEMILSGYTFSEDYEFTIECNPEHINEEKIRFYKKIGINRISLGVQTFDERLLKLLNRGHTKEMIYTAIALLRKHDINNISMDLMFAIPFQTIQNIHEDLAHIKTLNVPHISYYSLILEEKTVFEQWLSESKIQLVENEVEANMYELTLDALKDLGYTHYEISNYAKKGFQSKHNLVYWNNESYYGFGMGASGYINHFRYYNENKVNRYIEKVNENKFPIKNQDLIDRKEEIKEAFLLGLRLIDGLSINEVNTRYQIDILDYFKEEFTNLVNKGYIEINDRIKLTHKGLFYGNDVFQVFI